MNVDQKNGLVHMKALTEWAINWQVVHLIKELLLVLEHPQPGCGAEEMEAEFKNNYQQYQKRWKESV